MEAMGHNTHVLASRPLRSLLSVGLALVPTFVFFLVLPFMQSINPPFKDMVALRQLDAAELPPPPPIVEEEEPEEEPEPEEPPQLEEEQELLDLSQLELALNPSVGSGALAGDMSVDLSNIVGGGGDGVDEIFSLADLDQRPRVLYQASPVIDAQMRKRAPGKVVILFIVDERGRVENPIVQSSSDPIFERPALKAVKQWRFEPGKRKGEPVQFRMRVPISFPKE